MATLSIHSLRLVLCTLCLCFFNGNNAFRILFPSLQTKGFAYIEDTGEIVTIPAALDYLLCSEIGQRVSFKPAMKPCSRVLFFTSDTFVVTYVLNLSPEGVVRNFKQQSSIHYDELPREKASRHGENLSERSETVQGDKEVFNDVRFRRLTQESRVEVGGSSVDKIDPAVLKVNETAGFLYPNGTIRSDLTFYLQGSFSTLEIQQDIIYARITREINGSQVSRISYYLYADSNPLEVNIEEVLNQKNESNEYPFEVRFSQPMIKKLDEELASCSKVVEPLQSLIDALTGERDRPLHPNDLMAMIHASEEFSNCGKNLKLNQTDLASLFNVTGATFNISSSLEEISIDRLTRRDKLNGTVVKLNLSVPQNRNTTVNISINPNVGVSLFGGIVNSTTSKDFNLGIEPAASPELSVSGAASTPEAPESGPIQRPAPSEDVPESTPEPFVSSPVPSPEAPESSPIQTPGPVEEVPVRTQEPSVSSPAPTPEAPESSPIQAPEFLEEVPVVTSKPSLPVLGQPSVPSTEEKTQSVIASEKAGQAASIVTGTATGVALVASVGAPLITSFASGGASGAMQATSSLSNIVDLLQSGQKAYLMTKIAVPNLPKNFISFGKQFRWTMLDFKLPWEDDSKTNERLEPTTRKLLSNSTNADDEDNGSVYDTLQRAYFWTAISFASLVLVHMMFIAIFLYWGRKLPTILRIPRLELHVLHWAIAILASGPAILFSGSTNQIILGIVTFVLCVVSLLGWHLYILGKYVLNSRRVRKGIVYALDDVTTQVQSNDADAPSLPDEPVTKEKGNEDDQCWFRRYILGFLFGNDYHSGKWTPENDESFFVVDRYGPNFEDYRGKPVHLIEHEEGPNNGGDQSRRYEEVPAEDRYRIDVSEFSYTMRVCEKLFALVKMVLITCIILGEDSAENNAQAYVLLIIHIIYLIYLRVFRPHCSRRQLVMAMIEEILDILIVLLVICKLNEDKSNAQINVGVLMVVLEAIIVALRLIDIALTTLPFFTKIYGIVFSKGLVGHDRAQATHSVFLPVPQTCFEERVFDSTRRAFNNSRRVLSERFLRPVNKGLKYALRVVSSNDNRVEANPVQEPLLR